MGGGSSDDYHSRYLRATMCACMLAHTRAHVRVRVHGNVLVHACVCVHVYVCASMCMHAHTYESKRVCAVRAGACREKLLQAATCVEMSVAVLLKYGWWWWWGGGGGGGGRAPLEGPNLDRGLLLIKWF